jgi:hypothetical protein
MPDVAARKGQEKGKENHPELEAERLGLVSKIISNFVEPRSLRRSLNRRSLRSQRAA